MIENRLSEFSASKMWMSVTCGQSITYHLLFRTWHLRSRNKEGSRHFSIQRKKYFD